MTTPEETLLDIKRNAEAIPLPQKDTEGIFSIEASEQGKEIFSLMEQVDKVRKDYWHAYDRSLEKGFQEELALKSAELATKIGRSLGMLPSHISDQTLQKEADFEYHPDYTNGYTLVNPYGEVALSLRPPYGKEDDGNFTVDYSLLKQGEKTGLKYSSSIKVSPEGKLSFIPHRLKFKGDEIGGTLEQVQTIEDGRIIADLYSVPEKGVSGSGVITYSNPSQHNSPIPMEFKIAPHGTIFTDKTENDEDYSYRWMGDVRGKTINVSKVLDFMRRPRLDGQKEITNHEDTIKQFLE